jgi:hypothetical protein
MRQARIAFAFACLLVSAAAFAQTQLTATPSSFFQYASEETIRLSGSGIAGADHTMVVFSSRAGTFPMGVDPLDANTIEISLPPFVTQDTGTWSIEVDAYDTATGSPRQYFTSITVNAIPQTNPPILGLPESVFGEASSSDGGIVTFIATAINDDGSPVTVSCDHASGALYPLGTTLVSCSATNSFGTSTGSFTILVTDTVPPVLTLPSNIFSTDPVVTWTASATDALDAAVPVLCSPASGSSFVPGTTLVRCKATDLHNNVAFGTFKVTIAGGPPNLTLPDDFAVEATSGAGAVVTYSATTDPDATVACSPASGSTFALYTTVVNCVATNASPSTTPGSFNVTVVDTTPPSISAPSTVIAAATSASGATVNYTVTATDVVDGPVGVACSPASGTTFALGLTNVDCFATDAHNNMAGASFTVDVIDTPPTITSLTVSPSVLWPPNHAMIPVTVTATATDLADPHPTVRIISISSNQAVDAVDAGDAKTSPDWLITGPLTAQLRAERTSGVDRIYTIVVQAMDAAGGSTTATVQVKVSQQPNAKSRAVQ